MLTPSQIQWAAAHDWFIRANADGSIIVRDEWSQRHADGSVSHHSQQLLFVEGFTALRDWAGY